MFIVDLNTLKTVYTLNLTDHVILNCTNTLDSKDIMRVYTTFCKLIPSLHNLSVHDLDTGTVWNQVSLGITSLRICYDDLSLLLGVIDCSNTLDFSDNSKSFRLSCLKKLLDTRKTLCDISTGNTTTVESTHGKLCTWLTDRLSSDDTDRFTNLYRLAGCKVRTVTFRTDTNFTFTCKDCTDLNFLDRSACLVVHAFFHDAGSTFRCDHMVGFYDNFAIFILNCLTGETTCDTLLKSFDLFFTIYKRFYIHT